ncbi:FHA domain protein [Paraburkholderia unamae]|nr:FHA domain protein [Paraburkholderia unamae]
MSQYGNQGTGMQITNPLLTLSVAKYNDEPLAEPITVRFGPDGGTIGRATTCTLVLPDQQRAISRVHARVECRGGDYLLCDLGANPSVLNRRALGGTREARLTHGDQLMIGAYLIEVALVEGGMSGDARPFGHDPLATAQVLGGAAQSAPDAGLPGSPLGAAGMGGLDALGQASFGASERIAARPGFAGSESDHVSPELQAFAPPTLTASPASAHAASCIPADYDPLADALAQWESSGGTAQTPGPFSPTGQAALPSVVHARIAAPVTPAAAPPLDPFAAPFTSAAAPAPGGPTGLPAGLLGDPVPGGATPFDDLFSPVVPVVPSAAPAQARVKLDSGPPEAADVFGKRALEDEPDRAPASSPAAREAPAQSPAQPPAPATSPQPSSQGRPLASGIDEGVLAALYEGLGLDPARTPNLPAADFARLAGMMLRESLRGTMSVLRARSMTKREARLGTTVIVERDNNPLKFFPDVDSALAQMLTGRTSGYLPPDEAVARAFVDIESHELAVLVGMRAALAQVLARFDPAVLEAQLAEQGVLDRVLSNRKAKLWDRFVEMRAGIVREAEEDFQKLFGQAFNEAYEAQVEAMHRARDAASKSKKDPT